LGLVNAIVAREDLASAAMARAEALTRLPQGTVLELKRLMREPSGRRGEAAINRELEAMSFSPTRRRPEGLRWLFHPARRCGCGGSRQREVMKTLPSPILPVWRFAERIEYGMNSLFRHHDFDPDLGTKSTRYADPGNDFSLAPVRPNPRSG
jgi:hypothetical protein